MVLGALDKARHHLDMPIDLGLSEILCNSRTGHNAHVPPRIFVEVACRADASGAWPWPAMNSNNRVKEGLIEALFRYAKRFRPLPWWPHRPRLPLVEPGRESPFRKPRALAPRIRTPNLRLGSPSCHVFSQRSWLST